MNNEICEQVVSQCSRANWLTDSKNLLSDIQRDWLFDNGSLTAKLQNICDKFEVLLLSKGWHRYSDEYSVRQVLLFGDNRPWIWGVTTIRTEDLVKSPALSTWKDAPLGHLLFSKGVIHQRKFEIADFSQDSSFVRIFDSYYDKNHGPIWARKAEIWYEAIPLSLTEVFLPLHPMYGA